MLEKFYGFQVLVSAVFIGYPLTVLFAVIQIKHRRHGVHPDTVHMEFPQPEKHIGDEEILHLRLAVIEDLGAPVRM